MSQSRLQLKVGAFVFFCLILVAVLLVQFSKGTTFFRQTYTVILKTANVGGLRPRASVLMSGVQVGTISEIQLSPQGTNVSILLKIYNQYVIRNDARFVIEQSGFLGDQYVAIYPDKSQGMPLTNLAEMPAQEPFNLQEVARSASGFIKHIDDTASNLNAAIIDVRREVLNERTLTNLAFTIDTLEHVSVSAGTVVDNLNSLIISNGVPAGTAVSNLLIFSQQMNTFAQSAQGILDTNRPQINAAVSNLHNSTVMLTNLLAEVRDGKGLVGTLLRNEDLANNVSALASNLALASANLNRLGLWHFLWYHPKPTATNAPPHSPARPGSNP
jgi:phospholipid/cholesterol/gamma-HCH transport system substrate-binding protein